MATKKKDPASLGDAAGEALAAIANDPTTEPLDDTDSTNLKFVGVSLNTIKSDFKIGDEIEFSGKGRIVGMSDEESARDGHVRHTVKVKTLSVDLV